MTEQVILDVWKKWQIVSWNDTTKWRKDECWAWIWYDFYWNRESEYGWEIDHISPQSNWWNDNLSNLRPLQWENNLNKSNWRLSCKIIASWVHNTSNF